MPNSHRIACLQKGSAMGHLAKYKISDITGRTTETPLLVLGTPSGALLHQTSWGQSALHVLLLSTPTASTSWAYDGRDAASRPSSLACDNGSSHRDEKFAIGRDSSHAIHGLDRLSLSPPKSQSDAQHTRDLLEEKAPALPIAYLGMLEEYPSCLITGYVSFRI